MPKHSPTLRAYPQNGFALLITITLLAFLVLLLVSLASLTRVETQVAGNSQQLSKARQNALFALNLALGELQKYAGPDQRITAPADLLASTDRTGAATVAPAASAIAVQPGTRRWTGVWGNSQTAIGYDLRPDQISGRGVTPALLNWLVSGNEKTTYTLNTNAKGGVVAGPAPAVSPAAPGATSVELVGENTAGTSAEDKVSAPLVNLYAPAGQTPGADPTTTPLTGRYAWWVGDEGVKARVNLQPGYVRTHAPTDQINAFITSQRSAFELMDRDNSAAPLPINTSSETTLDSTDTRLPNITTPVQLSLINTGNTVLPTAIKARFHDLTTSSATVLSDTYAGGLKKDLTADIADSTLSGNNSAGDRPADTDPLFKPLKNNSEVLPTWGHLRSWARLHPDGSNALAPVLPSATSAGLNPMLMYASLGMDIYVDGEDPLTYVPGTSPPYTVHAAFFPVVLLNNPYPFTLAASKYRIGFQFGSISNPNPSYFSVKVATTIDSDAGSGTQVGLLELGTPAFVTTSAPTSVRNFIYFTIDCPEIPPGETHAYRLRDAESPYSPGMPMARFPAFAAGMPTGLTNHATLASFLTLPPAITTNHNLKVDLGSVGCTIALGSDADLTNTANRYQSYSIGVVNSVSVNSALTGTSVLINGPTSPSRQKISPWWYFPGGTNGARAALRLLSPLEGQSLYSSNEHYGMPAGGISWLRHGNLRAPYTTKRLTTDSGHDGTGLQGVVLANDKIPFNLAGRCVELIPILTGYATGIMGSDDEKKLRRMTLFDILKSSDRLLSLGQFQNAPLSRYGFQPAYPFANSGADMRISRTATYAGTASDSGNVIVRTDGSEISDPMYDLSWHLNRALWDRYFVAGAPSDPAWDQTKVDAQTPLLNTRHVYYKKDAAQIPLNTLKYTGSGANTAYDQAAAHLLVAGGFNINSTSEQAWRAILGGPLGVTATAAGDYAYSTGPGTGDRVNEIIPYARFSNNLSQPSASLAGYPALQTTMTSDSATADTFRSTLYYGNRGLWLNDSKTTTNTSAAAVVNELAHRIVLEIRTRGPFLSLADFINRPILASAKPIGIKGPLQSAIDNMDAATAQANPYAVFKSQVLATAIRSGTVLPTAWDHEHFLGGPKVMNGTDETSPGSDIKTAFAPKYLTQADILSTLGPQLTARSDTFMIRTYGESLNAATQTQEGRAWCEAIVQRVPDYVDSSQDAAASPATGLNATWGRKFKVVSFRWLSPQDI